MRSLMVLMLLSSMSLGQLTVASRIESYVEFKTPPRVVGNRVYYATDSKATEGQMAFVVVTGPADMVRVKAKRMTIVANRIVTERAGVEKIGPREFAITGDGTYTVEVTGFSKTDVEDYPEFEITLGKLPPKPEPDPLPPEPQPDDASIPSDGFDNIGRRIAQWSAGLPKRAEVGAVYLKYANKLSTDPSFQIVQAFTSASADRLSLLGADGPKYNDIVQKINLDVASRGPMGKGVVIDYFKAIARGYGVK